MLSDYYLYSNQLSRLSQYRPTYLLSLIEFQTWAQEVQGNPGLHVTTDSDFENSPGFWTSVILKQVTIGAPCNLRTWQTYPEGLMRYVLARHHRLTSSSMQASQFSPLSGPHTPLQQEHFPSKLPLQQYLEVIPRVAFSPRRFQMGLKQLLWLQMLTFRPSALLFLALLSSLMYLIRYYLASGWCSVAVCLGRSACQKGILQSLQLIFFFGHLSRWLSIYPNSTWVSQNKQGTLISDMTLRAIREGWQVMVLLLQHGHYPNLLKDFSMHYWQQILVQQALSTASLASQRHRGHVKLF